MMWKYVFTHVSSNAYEEMEMKNGGEIMSFIVTFGEKGKWKYMEDENDILFWLSKMWLLIKIGPFGCNYM